MHSLKCVSAIELHRTETQALKRTTGSGHQSPGLWQNPQDKSSEFNDLDHWIKLAQLLESSKFHGMFIADVLGMSLKLSLSDSANASGPFHN